MPTPAAPSAPTPLSCGSTDVALIIGSPSGFFKENKIDDRVNACPTNVRPHWRGAGDVRNADRTRSPRPVQADSYTEGLSSALGNGSSRPKRYKPANPEANPAAAPSAMDHANPRVRWISRKVTHIRNPVRAPKSARLRTRNSERCPHRAQVYEVEKTTLGNRAGVLQCGQVFMKYVRWYNPMCGIPEVWLTIVWCKNPG